MPAISVVIPTRNRAALLGRAIASVLDQTFRDFEIIVADDGSTDSTAQRVQSLPERRIRYCAHPAARGEAAAANLGIARASGEYIAFLHDDDVWRPAKLEQQVGLFKAVSSRVAAIYTGFHSVDERTGATLATIVPSKRGDIFDALRGRNCIGVPSTVMVRRTCLEAVGHFDESIAAGADYDLWIRLARRYHFDFIAAPLVLYSVHAHRLSTNWPLLIAGAEAILAKHEGYFAADRRNYSAQYYNLGVMYCLTGNRQKGSAALRKAIDCYPFDLRYYFQFALARLGTAHYQRVHQRRDTLAQWLKACRPS
jgi:glycosyltransferase involved in cell wall biosynthesis